MLSILQKYYLVPRSVVLLSIAELMLFVVNSAFILILNILLRKHGYSDAQIANYTSYRFLGVLVFAFPFGIYIKGKRLKPFFIVASIVIPVASFFVITAIKSQNDGLLHLSFLSWGVGLMLLQVCVIPFIMRITPDSVVSESLSMNFSTWFISMILAGILITILTNIGSISFGLYSWNLDEANILYVLILLSLTAFFIMLGIEEGPPRSSSSKFVRNFKAFRHEYDWNLILKAIVPTLIISVGAGLTIPFINLFFYSVFLVDSQEFSIYGSIAAFLVLIGAFFVPNIRRIFGFKIVILGTQFLSIVFLLVLALTEVFQHINGIFYLAVGCFLFRQPLMNMANPLTSELTMKYVGEKNQELISALTSSIWSASWFLSAKIFQTLRALDLEYYKIFLMTSMLYVIGVSWYYLIIKEYENRNEKVGSTMQAVSD